MKQSWQAWPQARDKQPIALHGFCMRTKPPANFSCLAGVRMSQSARHSSDTLCFQDVVWDLLGVQV